MKNCVDQEVCPRCNSDDCIPEVAFRNCEIYGNEFFTVKCNHCGKMVNVYMKRTVVLESITKSNKEIADF